MDPQAALVDRDTRPHPRHQIVLADDLAGLLNQDDQNVERAGAEVKRSACPFDKSLCRIQPEWAERNDFIPGRAGIDSAFASAFVGRS